MTKTQAQATLPDLVLARSTEFAAEQQKALFEKIYHSLIFKRWRTFGMTLDHYRSACDSKDMPDGLNEDQKDVWAIFHAWYTRPKGERYADSVGRVVRAAQERKEARP